MEISLDGRLLRVRFEGESEVERQRILAALGYVSSKDVPQIGADGTQASIVLARNADAGSARVFLTEVAAGAAAN